MVLIGSVLVGALSGPLIPLVFGTVASNTIEGIAISKLIKLVVLVPTVVVAVVPEPFQFITGALPAFWPIKAIVPGVASESWTLYLLAGAFVHFLWFAILSRACSRSANRVLPKVEWWKQESVVIQGDLVSLLLYTPSKSCTWF